MRWPFTTAGCPLEIIALLGNNIGLIFAALPLVCLAAFIYGFYANISFTGRLGIVVLFGYSLLVLLYAWFWESHRKTQALAVKAERRGQDQR